MRVLYLVMVSLVAGWTTPLHMCSMLVRLWCKLGRFFCIHVGMICWFRRLLLTTWHMALWEMDAAFLVVKKIDFCGDVRRGGVTGVVGFSGVIVCAFLFLSCTLWGVLVLLCAESLCGCGVFAQIWFSWILGCRQMCSLLVASVVSRFLLFTLWGVSGVLPYNVVVANISASCLRAVLCWGVERISFYL